MSFTTSAASSEWFRKKKVVAGSTFEIVDKVSLGSFRGIRYCFCVYNKAQDKTKMFDMNLIQNLGVVKESVFATIGVGINFAVDTFISAGDVSVKVTNNESYDLTVELIKSTFN